MVASNCFATSEAETCLRNIAEVKPGGYLFVTGIDLDVRTMARDLCLQPVPELIEETHEGGRPCGEAGPSSARRSPSIKTGGLPIRKRDDLQMQPFSG
jgi:hypothetical protein